MYDEMNRLARIDRTFHPLVNQVLQKAPLHPALPVTTPIEDPLTVVAPPVVVPVVDSDDEVALDNWCHLYIQTSITLEKQVMMMMKIQRKIWKRIQ